MYMVGLHSSGTDSHSVILLQDIIKLGTDD